MGHLMFYDCYWSITLRAPSFSRCGLVNQKPMSVMSSTKPVLQPLVSCFLTSWTPSWRWWWCWRCQWSCPQPDPDGDGWHELEEECLYHRYDEQAWPNQFSPPLSWTSRSADLYSFSWWTLTSVNLQGGPQQVACLHWCQFDIPCKGYTWVFWCRFNRDLPEGCKVGHLREYWLWYLKAVEGKRRGCWRWYQDGGRHQEEVPVQPEVRQWSLDSVLW